MGVRYANLYAEGGKSTPRGEWRREGCTGWNRGPQSVRRGGRKCDDGRLEERRMHRIEPGSPTHLAASSCLLGSVKPRHCTTYPIWLRLSRRSNFLRNFPNFTQLQMHPAVSGARCCTEKQQKPSSCCRPATSCSYLWKAGTKRKAETKV